MAAEPMAAQMHVLYWGTYDTGKPRTRILRKGILASGVTLRECHAPVWEGIEDKSQLFRSARRIRLVLRWFFCYPALLWRFLRAPKPDVVLVGFPGILDVIALAPLARLRSIPLAWDMFMSLYDTVVVDRQLLRPTSLLARLLHWAERYALRRADLVFLDTQTHARRIESMFRLPAGHCGTVWVGAEVEHFRVAPSETAQRLVFLRVLFYGQFIPLHGIETIIGAARLMRDDEVEWILIGRGQQAPSIRNMLHEVPLPKLRWIDWVEYASLKSWLAETDICLGIFGTSEKAASVIPNKVFQAVAAGRPLITRDGPAIRELLTQNPPCVYLVPAGSPEALAEAVREYARQFSGTKLPSCHAELAGRIDASAIGKQFVEFVTRRLAVE